MLILAACRKEWTATEEDMTNYGWTLFEQASLDLSSNTAEEDFEDVLEWFEDATKKDTSYQDGYNGLGWSFGKLVDLDSAILVFEEGLEKPPNPRMFDIVTHDILAGLTFAHSALKHDSIAVNYGDSLIWLLEQQTEDKTWNFPHDSTTNYLDVHVTLALSYFALSDFTESLEHVQAIKAALNPASPPWEVNTTTITGRNQLAGQIEYLQTYLQDR